MMKKEYFEPAINVKVVLAEQLLAASVGPDVSDEEVDGDGDAKPAFSIWEVIESKE